MPSSWGWAFPGRDHIVGMLFGTPYGWAMLLVGTAVGSVFAAFASRSAFSPYSCPGPAVDALTAMATSMELVSTTWRSTPEWGAIVWHFYHLRFYGAAWHDGYIPTARTCDLACLPGDSGPRRTRRISCCAPSFDDGLLLGGQRQTIVTRVL